jgi:hypothetical protein
VPFECGGWQKFWIKVKNRTRQVFVIDMAAIHTGNRVGAGAYSWNGDNCQMQ